VARIPDYPVATEEEIEDETVDYVVGVVNGEAMLVPVALLGGE
jgi:hypothetical protein